MSDGTPGLGDGRAVPVGHAGGAPAEPDPTLAVADPAEPGTPPTLHADAPLPRLGLDDPAGPSWWLGLLFGGAIFAFGLLGLLHNSRQTIPTDWIKWVAGGVVLHDAIFAPAVLVAGYVLTRLLPAAIRAGVQATFAICGVVALFSVPVLKHVGRRPDNPSLLPHDYTSNLAIVLAVILAGGLLLTFARAALARRRRPIG